MVRRTKKGGSLRIDFSGVENRGRFHTEGDYLLRVKEVTQEKGDKADYLNWVIECAEGEDEGAVLYNNTSLAPQSLWNVKAFLEALGVEVPDDEMDLDLPEYVGLEFMGTVEMEPWEGKKRPRLADFWAAEEKPAKKKRGSKKDDDEEDEDEKPKRDSKKAGKKKEPDPVSEDEINDMDQEELADLIAENDLDVDLADFKTLRKMRAAVIDAAQEAGIVGEAEDDTAEEDEKPSRGKRGSKKDDADDEDEKPSRRSRSKKDDADEEDEDEKPARSRRRR